MLLLVLPHRARYNAAGNASTGEVQTIYGIVHKNVNSKTGVTVYESSELLWAAINESVTTSTTITAGDALSGGGALSGDITIRHNTITTTQSSETATTLAHDGTFSAITSVSTDGMGHATGNAKWIHNRNRSAYLDEKHYWHHNYYWRRVVRDRRNCRRFW